MWYVVALVLSSRVADTIEPDPLSDLQFRLVRARSSESARQRALDLGRQEEHAYTNEAGEEVRWDFVGVADVRPIDGDQLVDGTELYSQLFRHRPTFTPTLDRPVADDQVGDGTSDNA